MPIRKGVRNDGTEWQSQEFVFEYYEHETDWWSNKVLLSVMNDRIQEVDMHVGDEFRIGFSHRIREYQGRVFNDIVLNKIEKVVAQQPGTQPQQPVTGGGYNGVPL